MRVPAAASTRVCAVTAACVTVPEVGVGASVMWHCVGSAAAGTAACACRLSGATVRRATQGTDARTLCVLLSVTAGVLVSCPAYVRVLLAFYPLPAPPCARRGVSTGVSARGWVSVRVQPGTRVLAVNPLYAPRPASTAVRALLRGCVPALMDTAGRGVNDSSARVGVAWVGPAWVWSGASVEAGSPGPHAPFPCVTRRVPTGELAPAPECVLVPRGTPAAGAPSRSVNTYPSKWNTRGRTRRRCQSGFRRTAGPGAGRRAPPSDRATRPSRRSFTEQCTLVRLPPPRPE